jgi:hypothetical protein
MSMKNCNDNIGIRTRDLPACSAVPQPTAPSRAHSTNKRMNCALYIVVVVVVVVGWCQRQCRVSIVMTDVLWNVKSCRPVSSYLVTVFRRTVAPSSSGSRSPRWVAVPEDTVRVCVGPFLGCFILNMETLPQLLTSLHGVNPRRRQCSWSQMCATVFWVLTIPRDTVGFCSYGERYKRRCTNRID